MPSFNARPISHGQGTLKPLPIAVSHIPRLTVTQTYKDGGPTTGLFGRTQLVDAARQRARVSTNITCETCKVANIECTADRPACERCAVKNLKCVYAARGTGRYGHGAETSLGDSTQSTTAKPTLTADPIQPANLKRRAESEDQISDQPPSKKARTEDHKDLRVPLAALAGMTPRQLLALASKLGDGTKPGPPSSFSSQRSPSQSQPHHSGKLSAFHTDLAMTGLRNAGFRRMFQVVRLPTMEDMIFALTEDGRHISGLTSSPTTSSSSSSLSRPNSPDTTIDPSASKQILGWDKAKSAQAADKAKSSGSKTGMAVSAPDAHTSSVEDAAPYFVPPYVSSKRTSSTSSLNSTFDDLFDEPYALRPMEAEDWSATSQYGSEGSQSGTGEIVGKDGDSL